MVSALARVMMFGRPRRTEGPRASPEHKARIEEYRRRIESGEGIFGPPSPERPVSYLFEHMTVGQIERFVRLRSA